MHLRQSPIILNAVEIKLDTVIYLQMEEITKAKTSSGDFTVTTPKNTILLITSGYKYKESYQTLWPIPK